MRFWERNGPLNQAGYRERLAAWIKSEGMDPADVPAWPGVISYCCGIARIEVLVRDSEGRKQVEGNDLKTRKVWRRVKSPPPLQLT